MEPEAYIILGALFKMPETGCFFLQILQNLYQKEKAMVK